jgi:hypothetical protein
MWILAKSRRLATGLAALAIGIAPPAAAQTVTPSSGVWTVTNNNAAVNALTNTLVNSTPPFTFTMTQPTASNSYPVTITAPQVGFGSATSFSYSGPVYNFTGTGAQGSTSLPQQGYIVAPNFNIVSTTGISNTGATATPATAASQAGTPALLAVSSTGADGAPAGTDKSPGGGSYNAGAGGGITITQIGNLSLGVSGFSNPNSVPVSPYAPIGSAIIATSQGGVGSDPSRNDLGPGMGGAGGTISVTTTSGTITLQNTTQAGNLNGITALSVGNSGGANTNNGVSYLWGVSGNGGSVNVNLISNLTAGAGNTGNLIGIAAASVGGAPYVPYSSASYDSKITGLPPNNGGAGPVAVNINAGAAISLPTGNAIGVLASSVAGTFGVSCANTCNIAPGGAVNVSNLASITTGNANASFAAGIIAVSAGSSSIIDPFGTHAVSIGTVGLAGTVNVANGTASQTGATITTTGTFSIGMAGLSLGTASIVTGAASSGVSVLGNSSAYGTATSSSSSGATGAVTLSNTGTITTNGASAFGMVAMSVPAGGLLLSNVNSAFTGSTVTTGQYIGNASSNTGADGGTITVTNAGSITTGSSAGGGNMAIGILAHSIGGGGGSSGGSGAAAFVGDKGGSGGAGGAITITNSGTITTANDGAIGILTQSIGGGGGNGGNAKGLFVAVGGQGGLGGAGGAITLNLGATSGSVGSITTSGDFAMGVVAHSIGGGGGNGGYAKAAGPFFSSAIGGAGGSGGAGGTILFTNNGQPISTGSAASNTGNGAHGVLLQSIGGGGGTGGGAISHSAGVIFAESLAVGGTGGSGGAGGAITATNSGAITTSNPDAIGLLVQSIGGGGGNAGGAMAKALAIAGDPQFPTLAFSTTVGGTGGSGGAGGTITIANTGNLSTAGSSAFGINAQSIGGGGGNGGDSTAGTTLVAGKSGGLQMTTSLGGSGGTASNGGSVSITNGISGPSSSAPVGAITTTGNNATAMLAQSIGGGGGTGGGGNAVSGAPNLGGAGVTPGFTLGISTALGGKGGSGGEGGGVSVTNYGPLSTIGSGGQGILAQSIGGGGGSAGGGSAAGGGSPVNINLSVGGSGGGGGAGAGVSVTNGGTIATGGQRNAAFTTGGDAVGIMAQSIGGGGGTGGSSDPVASVSTATMLQNLLAGSTPLAYAANLNIGGSGGSGGAGGTVSVSNPGFIETLGIRAHGILAQSIGGGGGWGGAVVTQPGTLVNTINGAISQWVAPTISSNIGLGGSGGSGGAGGAVSIANNGVILTAGYGALGVLAQSVGGGGGVGADGSTGMGISILLGGNGGAGNTGGTVSLGTPGAPLTGTIATVGDDAHALIAQSIGGGGGLASGICTNGTSAGLAGVSATRCIGNTSVSASVVPWAAAGALSLNMPGSTGNAGNGGAVSVYANGAILTAGDRAMGIVAQSIGGGGGFITAAAGNIANTTMAISATAGPGQNYASAGTVTVSLGSGGSITTFGAGAWGILAQSIGGGGGFMGDPSMALAMPVSNQLNPISTGPYANGGAVNLTLAGTISTTGANAHGVVAQSIGDGGGILSGGQYQTSATVGMGNTITMTNYTGPLAYSGGGNTITINQTGGSIKTSGAGSIGILAQSSGALGTNASPYVIAITIAGTVSGGSGTGAGILVSGGANTISTPNTITVNSGGNVTSAGGTSGTAVRTNYGYTNLIINAGGTVTGSVHLGSTPGDITTNLGGTFNAGQTVVVAQSTFTNAGNLFIAGQGAIGTTTISGGFKQTATGIMGIDVNALAPQRSDQFNILGNAQIGGTIVPTATTLLPGSLPVVTATTLSSTATVQQSIAFGWNAAVSGNTLAVTPVATFRPAGLTLSRSQGSLADYLTRGWNNADQRFAGSFGYLSQIQGGSHYVSTLATVAGQPHTAQPQAMLNNAPMILGSAMGCPAYASAGTVLLESGCLWARLTGGWGRQSADSGDSGYNLSSVFYRLGGQYEVAPGWFLGTHFGFGQNWTQATGFSSTGTLYDGSVTLQRSLGRWTFSGAFAIGSGEFRNNRSFVLPAVGTLPGTSAAFQSNSNLLLFGGRGRAAYEIPFSSSYVKPYADLDLVYSQVPGFQETGAAGLPLSFNGNSKTNVFFSPMVEFGGRQNLGADVVMRPYLDLGLTIRPDINRAMQAQVIGASGTNGMFNVYGNAPTVVGRMNLGVQLYHSRGIDLRLEYGLMLGGTYTGQTASARLAYQF